MSLSRPNYSIFLIIFFFCFEIIIVNYLFIVTRVSTEKLIIFRFSAQSLSF